MSKERRNEIKKQQNVKKTASIVAVAVAVVILVIGTLAFNINKCDDCGVTIIGRGYYKEKESAGVLGSVFGTFFGDTEGIPLETVEDVVICKECVKNNASVKAELRKANEFKR